MSYCLLTVTRNSYCLSNLATQIFERSIDELEKWFIIDNGSEENFKSTLKTIESMFGGKIEVVYLDKNYLFSYSNNLGLKMYLDGNYESDNIILINPDISFIPMNKDTVNHYMWNPLSAFQYYNCDIVGSLLLFEGSDKIEHFGGKNNSHCLYGEKFEVNKHPKQTNFDVDYVTGALMSIKKTTLQKIGLLDATSFTHWCSDQEYCLRAKETGLKVFCSTVPFYHNQGKSAGISAHVEVTKDLPEGMIPNIVPFTYEFILNKAKENAANIPFTSTSS